MSIEVTVRHGHLSAATQGYAKEKAQDLLDRFPLAEGIHVVMDRENRSRVVEIAIQAKRHAHIEATGTSEENLRSAIDMAVERAERQLRKQHDKVRDHRPKVAKDEVPTVTDGEEIEEGVL